MAINENLIDYLLEKSNVAIRYRVIRDLCEELNSKDYINHKEELICSERVKHLLQCLKTHKEYHGATIYAVENSLNMLIDMGFYYGIGFQEYDTILQSIVDEAKAKKIDSSHVLGYLSHMVVVPFLLRAGLRDEWLIEFTKDRINTIDEFVKQKDYNIYDDVSAYKTIPKNFQGRSIIRPCLYKDGKMKFPLLYDLYGFASIMSELDCDYQRKVDGIITYIVDDRFGTIEDGYGVLSDKKNYWAMGWAPKLTNPAQDHPCNPLLLQLDLMSRFPSVVHLPWFKQALSFIEQYADENGLYHFPKKYLTEKDSYWILGSHMSLGENRRQNYAMEVEGTFRVLLIRKRLNG